VPEVIFGESWELLTIGWFDIECPRINFSSFRLLRVSKSFRIWVSPAQAVGKTDLGTLRFPNKFPSLGCAQERCRGQLLLTSRKKGL
jgi:hypothetical protein